MNYRFSRRTLIRIVCFSLAIMGVLAASNIVYMSKLSVASNAIEATYLRSVEELCAGTDKIYSALTKSKCSASDRMLTKLSGELREQATNAKNALLDLPLSQVELSNTEKFFSQIGNYAAYLAKKLAADELDYEDYLTLSKLCEYAKNLRDKLYELESRLYSRGERLSELFEDLEDGSFVMDGISGIEDNFKDMPKLIYDGPYSDHILEKEPKMTADAIGFSREEAAKKAAKATGLEDWQLEDAESSEEGKMPSYRFKADGVTVSVTKLGGYLSYMLKSRDVTNEDIDITEAIRRAELYLDTLGIPSMTKTYYECYNNVLTVNFAYKQDDTVCYTDLIKVSVALDNGEILGFDARGFLVNHYERDLYEPVISKTEAQSKLSPNLSVVSSRLALIPTDNIDETLCWEFRCKTDDGLDVLVYINTATGDEEDILILLIMDKSTLVV